jgi:Spy/CpxP family protein refolding chaperone
VIESRMISRRYLLLLLASLPAARLPAQNTANLPWWTSPVVDDLGLSAEQKERIRKIVRSYRDRLFDARNRANKAEAELQDILNEATVDPNAARPSIDRLAAARSETTKVFTEMSVELRSVLTLAQWRELVKRWEEVKRTKRNRDTDLAP